MAWSWAQGKAGGNVVSGGSVPSVAAAAFGSVLTNPSLILVSIFYGSNTATAVLSVTDTALNSYQRISGHSDTTNGQAVEVWYAINKGTTASNVVTANFSPDQSFAGIIADEFTGGGPVPVLENNYTFTHTSAASPGPYVSGQLTPSVDGCLIYGLWIQDFLAPTNNAITANSPFAIATANNSTVTGDFATEWFSQGAKAAVNASFSCTFPSGTPSFVIATISFKASADDTYQETLKYKYSG